MQLWELFPTRMKPSRISPFSERWGLTPSHLSVTFMFAHRCATRTPKYGKPYRWRISASPAFDFARIQTSSRGNRPDGFCNHPVSPQMLTRVPFFVAWRINTREVGNTQMTHTSGASIIVTFVGTQTRISTDCKVWVTEVSSQFPCELPHSESSHRITLCRGSYSRNIWRAKSLIFLLAQSFASNKRTFGRTALGNSRTTATLTTSDGQRQT